MRALLKCSLFAIVLVGLSVPMLAQGLGPTPPPGQYINWTITLNPVAASYPSGSATYASFKDTATGKMHTRLSVECEYADYTDGTSLDVFLKGVGVNPEPKLIGTMVVENKSAALLLITAKAPTVTKGDEIIVTLNGGPVLMVGRF